MIGRKTTRIQRERKPSQNVFGVKTQITIIFTATATLIGAFPCRISTPSEQLKELDYLAMVIIQ